MIYSATLVLIHIFVHSDSNVIYYICFTVTFSIGRYCATVTCGTVNILVNQAVHMPQLLRVKGKPENNWIASQGHCSGP